MMRNLIITMMMCCVLSTAYADTMDHFFEQGSAWMDGIRSPKESNSGYQFSESFQGYHGSLGKIKGGKIYDNNGDYKGYVNSSGNVYDEHKRPVYHEGPSPFSFDDAVDHVIKHGNGN